MSELPDFRPVESPYLVHPDRFDAAEAATSPPKGAPGKKECRERLRESSRELRDLQRVLYAADRRSLLVVFQGLDAAGKDSAIRHIFTGVNPAGFQVSSFKAPSREELDHDFLWRSAWRLPERGRIGIFNRSYYEEVLVVRVHPQFLAGQRLPHVDPDRIWEERFRSIREHERHLVENGTVIVKFWLNVSRRAQLGRFLDRLEEPDKHWKFSARDVEETEHRDAYIEAFDEALRATSEPFAPWYAIPCDDKHFARMTMADILVRRLQSLGMEYPTVAVDEKARFEEMRALVRAKIDAC